MICDFAEYYHVLYWRKLPVRLAATLAAGLPEQSRCKKKDGGLNASTEQLMLARIVDQLAILLYGLSNNQTEKPKSMVELLISPKKEEPRHRVFNSKEDFMAAYNRHTGG